VAVAYADWQRAGAPHPIDVRAFAEDHRWPAFLIDTWSKDGSTLLDWLSLADIASLCHLCRQADVKVALAGSLGADEVARLMPAAPTWFAVRGAVCRARRREDEIDAEAVRQLAALIARAQITREEPTKSTKTKRHSSSCSW
jgi:uncharacterized protein (UPF0264 family)